MLLLICDCCDPTRRDKLLVHNVCEHKQTKLPVPTLFTMLHMFNFLRSLQIELGQDTKCNILAPIWARNANHFSWKIEQDWKKLIAFILRQMIIFNRRWKIALTISLLFVFTNIFKFLQAAFLLIRLKKTQFHCSLFRNYLVSTTKRPQNVIICSTM